MNYISNDPRIWLVDIIKGLAEEWYGNRPNGQRCSRRAYERMSLKWWSVDELCAYILKSKEDPLDAIDSFAYTMKQGMKESYEKTLSYRIFETAYVVACDMGDAFRTD